jgi:hypothetical protein
VNVFALTESDKKILKVFSGSIPELTQNKVQTKKPLSNISLLPLKDLKEHEDTDPKTLKEIKKGILSSGTLFYPVVVDRKTKVILDGHHRVEVFRQLGIEKIPTFLIDYFDPRVILDTWRNMKITKHDVLRLVQKGQKLPHKTTKHMFLTENGIVHISEITPRLNFLIKEVRK